MPPSSETPPPAPAAPRGRRAAGSARIRLRRPSLHMSVLWIVALSVVVVDQATKVWATGALADGHRIGVMGDALGFVLVRNPGAAFSFATGQTWIFSIVAIVVTAIVVRVSKRLGSMWWAVTLGLVLGGAVGNLIDRLARFQAEFVHLRADCQLVCLPREQRIADDKFSLFAAQSLRQIAVEVCWSIESREMCRRRIDVERTRQLIDDAYLRYASTAQHPRRPRLVLTDVVDIIAEYGDAVIRIGLHDVLIFRVIRLDIGEKLAKTAVDGAHVFQHIFGINRHMRQIDAGDAFRRTRKPLGERQLHLRGERKLKVRC